jgi:hypothetical protein
VLIQVSHQHKLPEEAAGQSTNSEDPLRTIYERENRFC